MPVRIAMIGTRGVPAQYGGFETAVEEVGRRLAGRGHEVVVYCRRHDDKRSDYLGMKLVHLPCWQNKVAETPSHTALSAMHVLRHPVDVGLVFNAANAPFLPLLKARGVPVATHVDGLEWKRGKWGRTGRRYYLACEALAVKLSDALIADARGIQDYYQQTYGAASEFIAYGAPIQRDTPADKLAELGLSPGAYHLVVARFEKENNLHLILDGYHRSRAKLPLIVVGSAPYADDYIAGLRRVADADPRIRMVGSVWDQQLLDQLYAHAMTYLHGHSVGGTNPSLLRAMGAGASVIAYDVVFNREVLGQTGEFFGSAELLADQLTVAEDNPTVAAERGLKAQARAASEYDWDAVAAGYERLCVRLLAGESQPMTALTRGRPERGTGRR